MILGTEAVMLTPLDWLGSYEKDAGDGLAYTFIV